jgi:hypothetical protein
VRSRRLRRPAAFAKFVICHCGRCRKAYGSSQAVNAAVLPSDFRWLQGEGEVTRFDLSTARSFSVAFCRHCGAQMPHATRSGRYVIVPGGALDGDPGQRPVTHCYWGSRAQWLEPESNLPRLDEAAF